MSEIFAAVDRVQREERVVEQVAARKERRIDRRIAKEHIERYVEPAVVSKRKRAEVNYYEGEYHDLPVAPKPKPVVKPVSKPIDNTFRYSFAPANVYNEDEPLMNRVVKPQAKPQVKPLVNPREEINLIDDDEDKPVKRRSPLSPSFQNRLTNYKGALSILTPVNLTSDYNEPRAVHAPAPAPAFAPSRAPASVPSWAPASAPSQAPAYPPSQAPGLTHSAYAAMVNQSYKMNSNPY